MGENPQGAVWPGEASPPQIRPLSGRGGALCSPLLLLPFLFCFLLDILKNMSSQVSIDVKRRGGVSFAEGGRRRRRLDAPGRTVQWGCLWLAGCICFLVQFPPFSVARRDLRGKTCRRRRTPEEETEETCRMVWGAVLRGAEATPRINLRFF